MTPSATPTASALPGSLVRARGRDWIVLPSPEPELLLLRPLTGGDETVGLFLPLEGAAVTPSSFSPPDPRHTGDTTGCFLLYDAARLRVRSGTAPFRSLGHIAVVPRPYQFVPLVMALRQSVTRLLIADDVGVGKTIEAGLIARELLDRGLARRLAVLCPAHLCDQWATELREKFALDPRVVQPSQMARLERELPRRDLSVYDYYPHLVCSIDFVKSERHREAFLRSAPDLVIVDEAHMAARPRGDRDQVQQQRHELVRALAADERRHLLLVTATPHSGIEESFRSLLGLLRPEFDPPDEAGAALDRRQLLPHVVQRRRRDLERWLGATTPFPERKSEERTYTLSAAYEALFNDVLDYCRETVSGGAGLRAQQQRVRHWAAIALLRCLLSSPDAADAVLATRAGGRSAPAPDGADEAGLDEIDAAYRPQVLDPLAEEGASDYVPAAPVEDAAPHLSDSERRRLADFRRRVRQLSGPDQDRKLAEVARAVGDLLRDGYRPIVFCRFISTAKYLEQQLPALLHRSFANLRVVAVTGEIGDEARREKVAELVREPVRVLVATDCLSEGINLQDDFDAVVHYDLPWNPNQLEQREGRVDRFGQRRPEVRTVLLYGANNPVDLVVLDVLIRKARTIRRDLGISVPVPVEPGQIMEAVVDNVLLRGRAARSGAAAVQLKLALPLPQVSRLHDEWQAAAEREQRQRAYFAQHGIQPDEVAREIEATDPVLGTPETVQRFLANALQRFDGDLRPAQPDGAYDLRPGKLRPALAARGLGDGPLRVAFDAARAEGALLLGRTHPLVAAVCDVVLGAALAPQPDERFARAGAMYTASVTLRTVVLLLRLRYLLREQVDEFAEEVLLAACQRVDGRPVWLEPFDSAAREVLTAARPAASMPPAERERQVAWALAFVQREPDWFTPLVNWRVGTLQAAHARLRALTRAAPLTVEPRTPPDILGCYVLVPAGGER